MGAALAWMVEGARRWYVAGRVMPLLPERVAADTANWRGRANRVYGFALEYLEPSTEHHIIADELYRFFDSWIKEAGNKSLAKETFFRRLKDHASESGWDIEKKYTKRRMDRLSRPPDDILSPPKESYQAWHGLRFKPEPVWHEGAGGQADEHCGGGETATTAAPDQSRSVDEQSKVSKVSTQSIPLSAHAGDREPFGLKLLKPCRSAA